MGAQTWDMLVRMRGGVLLVAGGLLLAGCSAGSSERATVLTAEAFAGSGVAGGGSAAEREGVEGDASAEAGAGGGGEDSDSSGLAGAGSSGSMSIVRGTGGAGGGEDMRIITLTPAEAAGVPLDEVILEGRAPEPALDSGGAGGAADPGVSSGGSEAALVDEFVGELNGRPIFAADFLAPHGARLRAEAREKSRERWLSDTFTLILQSLYEQLDNDLVVAEVLASLPPEQREPGLRRMRDALQQQLISQNRGSAQIAARRLAQEEGLTTEEYLEREREKLLVRSEFAAELRRRIQVTDRHVELEYRRRYEEYNPRPRARLRRIRVLSSDREGVEHVRRALETRAFAEVASEPPNTANREEGGLVEVEFTGQYEEATLFRSPEALNEAARRLEPGEVAGPIEAGAWTYWLKLEEISASRMPLYDAQLSLANDLMRRQQRLEENKHKIRLRERAGVTREMMADLARKLLEIADGWYYASSGPAPEPDDGGGAE